MGYTKSAILIMCLALSGCATMKSSTINEDGSSHEHSVLVPPFSKQKLADFGYFQQVDADGSYTQSIGTRGEGIDNSGQLDALKGLISLGQMLAPLIANGGAAQPDAVAQGAQPTGGLTQEQASQLNAVLSSIGKRLKALEDIRRPSVASGPQPPAPAPE